MRSRNRDAHFLGHARVLLKKFIIFKFLDIEYGEVDTKIDPVSFLLEGIYDRSRKS